ncbi:hypothetical protein DLK05_01830 [Ancylomarina longa]|uniref:Deoxyuridine 5'-triphosphate nucleotidohydrolase n=2 Tax=Ancylomarina longa TaxID=2487017 RepID=A0A434B083_9BACT|nr:hypothetical protein DLK05_01830 [Ancylomarina longa]
MKLDNKFKEAISNLPSNEKDKLLFRLLKKDSNLVNRLYFDLIDNKSIESRRQEMETHVLKQINKMTNGYYSPGYLHMDMRYLSGEITEHVRITRDHFGEVSLNLLMLNGVLQSNSRKIADEPYGKAYKCCMYIITRTFKILTLINKLHEDYFIDLKNDLQSLGNQISENEYLIKLAIQNGLDVNWLISVDIPDNIVQIHKDIRSQGFLK